MKNIGHMISHTSLGHNGCPVKKALVCGIRQHLVVSLYIKLDDYDKVCLAKFYELKLTKNLPHYFSKYKL